MGDQYEVCEGDTCQSIADKFGVSLDRFLYQNGLDFQCSYLQIGSKVCITDCCELHTVCLLFLLLLIFQQLTRSLGSGERDMSQYSQGQIFRTD